MYKNYHGSDMGWDNVLADAAAQTAPPNGFTVAVKKTPAEIAVEAVAANDPSSFSFSDDEFILSLRDASPETKPPPRKCGHRYKQLKRTEPPSINMPVKVISATTTSMTAAITDENQQAKKVDLEVTFATPLAAPPTPARPSNSSAT